MDFFRACLKKIRACPFSKATGPGLVHEQCFLGALTEGRIEVQESMCGTFNTTLVNEYIINDSHTVDVYKYQILVKCYLWAVSKYIYTKYDIVSIGKFHSA